MSLFCPPPSDTPDPPAEHRRRNCELLQALVLTLAPLLLLLGAAAFAEGQGAGEVAVSLALGGLAWGALRVPAVRTRLRALHSCPACGAGLGRGSSCGSCGQALGPLTEPAAAARPAPQPTVWQPPAHLAHLTVDSILARADQLRKRLRAVKLLAPVAWIAGVYGMLKEEPALFAGGVALFAVLVGIGMLNQRCPACDKMIIVFKGQKPPSHCRACRWPLEEGDPGRPTVGGNDASAAARDLDPTSGGRPAA